jgi:hypothetical protein
LKFNCIITGTGPEALAGVERVINVPHEFFGDDRHRAVGLTGDAGDLPVDRWRVRGHPAINFPVKILHNFRTALLPPHFGRHYFLAVVQNQRVGQAGERIGL